jgi:hypothetical protein
MTSRVAQPLIQSITQEISTQLNSTQLNSTQLNSTQLNSTQLNTTHYCRQLPLYVVKQGHWFTYKLMARRQQFSIFLGGRVRTKGGTCSYYETFDYEWSS